MKIFGADPLKSTSEIGIVQCKDCAKPILRSVVAEHAGALSSSYSATGRILKLWIENCKKYDLDKSGSKAKADDGERSQVRLPTV
jgi:SAGA-associated factor 73